MLAGCSSSSTTTTVDTSSVTTESSVVSLVNSGMTTAKVGKSQKSWTITSKSSDEQLVYKAVLTDATLLSGASTIDEIAANGGLIAVSNNKGGNIYDEGAVTEICIKKAGDDNVDLADLILDYLADAYTLAKANDDEETDSISVYCVENISVFTITPTNTIVNVAIDGSTVIDEYWYVVISICEEPTTTTTTPTVDDVQYSTVVPA